MIDRRLFGSQLGIDRIAREGKSFLFDFVAIGQLGLFYFRGFVDELGNQTILGELVISLALHLRLFVLRMDTRGGRLLIKQLSL